MLPGPKSDDEPARPAAGRPEFVLEADLRNDGTAAARLRPLAALTPEARAELLHRADPANWSAAAQRQHAAWARVVVLGVPVHGLAAAALPSGALAAAVRDPGTDPARLVVVGPEAADDAPLLLGDALLFRDEMTYPAPTTRRVLLVLPDRRVCVDAGGEVGWDTLPTQLFEVRAHAIAELRARVRGPVVEVAGVGSVWLVRPGGKPAHRAPDA